MRNAAVFLLLLLITATLAAQEQTASLRGFARDEHGLPVAGVTIEATRRAGESVNTTSDARGFFRFASLVPGRYTLGVANFASADITVDVSLGESQPVFLTVTALQSSERLTVEASVANGDDASGVVKTIDSEQLTELPATRNVFDAATLLGGVTFEPRARGISIHGASGAENRFLVDGVDVSNALDGTLAQGIDPEAAAQLQVKQTGYSAEYGGATGGVINVVTRSGSNEFSGWLRSRFGDSAWNGDRRANLQWNSVGGAIGQTKYDDRVRTTEPSVGAGGSILRDRLWYFGMLSRPSSETSRAMTFGDGSSGDFGQSGRSTSAHANLTARFGERVFVKVGGTDVRESLSNALPSSPSDALLARQQYDSYERNKSSLSYSSLASAQFSPFTTVNITAGHFSSRLNERGVPRDLLIYFLNSNEGFPDVPAALVRPEGFVNIAPNESTDHNDFDRSNYAVDLTRVFSLLGTHIVKGGVQFERLHDDVFAGIPGALSIEWSSPDAVAAGQPFGIGTLQYDMYDGEGRNSQTALFVQDSWSVSRATISVGLRAEHERVPNYYDASLGYESTAFEFGWSDKLAPRLGLDWNLRRNGSWKAFATYGEFYDRIKLQLPRNTFGGRHYAIYDFVINSTDWSSITCSGVNGLITDRPTCVGLSLTNVRAYVPPASDARYVIDPALKPMQSNEWSAGVAHRGSAAFSASARYVHKELQHPVDNVLFGFAADTLPSYALAIANPGEGSAKYLIAGLPALPLPKREYDALELEATARPARSIYVHGSYVLSRLWGNYSGAFSSDDLAQAAPYGSSYGNFLSAAFDRHGKPVYGRLATDRPHQLKIQALFDLPWATTVGFNQSLMSGTPVTTELAYGRGAFFPYGRGDLGRTPMLTQTDLVVSKAIEIATHPVELSVNVLNLFDEDTPIATYSRYSRRSLAVNERGLFDGTDIDALIAKLPRDRFYGAPAYTQPAREVRLTARVTF